MEANQIAAAHGARRAQRSGAVSRGAMSPARNPAAFVALIAVLAAYPGAAAAFNSKGHNVIEALVYRTLVEGYGRQPPRPDVLRDLINDGDLMPPVCFGRSGSEECRDVQVGNPLLQWPMPRTDWPDLNYRRQFSDEGQCFHFMATAADEGTAPIPGTRIPRDMAVRAVVRCRNLLDRLVDSVVEVGGRQTRQGGLGLYELMHAVQDSFSHAHTERQAGGGKIEFLRVWEPVGKLAGGRLGMTYSGSPTRHDSHEPRDAAFIRNFAEVDGRPCRDLVDFPYSMPFACLSEDGDAARRALVELLVTVHELQLARRANPASQAHPSESAAWQAYKARWLDATHACSGAECDEKQPAMRMPASNFLVGVEGTFSPSAETFGASLRGILFQYSPDLNPFVYGLGARVGYVRAYGDSLDLAVAGLDFDLLLPVGRHSLLGFTPAALRTDFGSSSRGAEIASQLAVLYWQPSPRLWFAFRGPVEVNWSRARADWAFGLSIGLAPSTQEVSPQGLIRPDEERAERHDDQWSPEPLWYGRLKGRVPSVYASLAVSAYTQPADATPGTVYGAGGLGASLFWDRDHWGNLYPTAWGGSLLIGNRRTSGPATYLTAAAALEWRWYLLKIMGLSVVPARVEYGPRISGKDYDDTSPFVSGTPPHQHYFQAGSRLGVAMNAGLVDLLVQGPTLAWNSDPFQGGELLSFQASVKLK